MWLINKTSYTLFAIFIAVFIIILTTYYGGNRPKPS